MGGEEREKKGTREDNSEMIEWEGRVRVATRPLMENFGAGACINHSPGALNALR